MNAGDILLSSPLVLENIFKYLEVEDLLKCAQVCSSWNKEVEYELDQRDIINQLLREVPFFNMVKDITKDVSEIPHNWEKGAVEILRLHAANFMNPVFDNAIISAHHAGREKVSMRDIKLSFRVTCKDKRHM